MSEGAESAHPPWHRGFIRNPQDFYGGVALIGLAVIALWASAELPGMRGFAFGPGTAPRLFALVLGAMGAWVLILGLTFDGPAVERYDITAPLLLSGAYVFWLFGKGTPGLITTVALALAGVVFAVIGLMGPRRSYVRGPLFIIISVLFFAATVRPLGLVISSFVTLMLCATAAEDMRWHESLLVAIALTAFCSLLFPWGLNLPMPLWPQFWR